MKRSLVFPLLAAVLCSPFWQQGVSAQEARSPATSLYRLQLGNARFVGEKPNPRDLSNKRLAELARGQQPFAVILTCADSRVAPELIFDQGLGDLFTIRIAGNVTDPAVLGSIEYAVEHLKTPLVVVMGHESCGAVKAALGKDHLHGNLDALIKEVHPGKELPLDPESALTAGIRSNVVYHAGQLTRKSAVIKEMVETKRVQIAGGVYSLKTGKVAWLELPAAGEGKAP